MEFLLWYLLYYASGWASLPMWLSTEKLEFGSNSMFPHVFVGTVSLVSGPFMIFAGLIQVTVAEADKKAREARKRRATSNW